MHFPKHIAIIPDGNRTRAKKRGVEQMEGHLAGQENSIVLMEYIFRNTPIEVATFWGLSTENLKNRTKKELDYLFTIYKLVIQKISVLLEEFKVSFQRAGNPVGLPDDLLEFLNTMKAQHSYDSGKFIMLGINYGGRDELLRGIRSWSKAGERVKDLTEEGFSRYLDFGSLPPVDFVIRTKGNLAKRISGFMLWRIGYAELFFSDLCFPDFTPSEFEKSLVWYDSIVKERNFGK